MYSEYYNSAFLFKPNEIEFLMNLKSLKDLKEQTLNYLKNDKF